MVRTIGRPEWEYVCLIAVTVSTPKPPIRYPSAVAIAGSTIVFPATNIAQLDALIPGGASTPPHAGPGGPTTGGSLARHHGFEGLLEERPNSR